jgi:hypothetical protein
VRDEAATGAPGCAPGCARTSRGSRPSRASPARGCWRSTPPGPAAQAERDATLRRFAARYGSSFEAARAERPELAVPAADALFVLAAGVDQLICARVREGALASCPT